jgi:hypothetical protein
MSSIISFIICSVFRCSVHNFADFIQDIKKQRITTIPEWLVNVTELVNITNAYVHL